MAQGLIQIAGVSDLAEARLLVGAGVDWLGFPLRLAVHPEDLTEAEAAQVIHTLPPAVVSVLITYLDSATEIHDFCRDLGVSHVQLHGDVRLAELRALRTLVPDLFIIKSLVVRPDNGDELEQAALALSEVVDAFITDTYDPATGACGATGKTHDWRVSRSLVATCPRPVLLAGGLTPDNVRRAIREVQPAGVDVHTGVETPDGRKAPDLVRRFVQEARAGFASCCGVMNKEVNRL